MNEWQPIETAPNNKLILAWMDGYETHSDVNWARYGYALMVMHDGEPAKDLLGLAVERIMGKASWVDFQYRHLQPTHWMPLPEPPK